MIFKSKQQEQGFTKSSIIVPIASLLGVFVFFGSLQLAKVGYFAVSVKPTHSSTTSKTPPKNLSPALKKDIKTYGNYIFSTYSTAVKWANTNVCSSIFSPPQIANEQGIFSSPSLASQAATALPYNSSPSLANLNFTNASSLSLPRSKGISIPQYCAIGFYSNAKLPNGKSFGTNIYQIQPALISSESSSLLLPGGISIPVAFEISIKNETLPTLSTSSFDHIFIIVELSGHFVPSSNSVVIDSPTPKILAWYEDHSTASSPSYINSKANFVLPAALKSSGL